MATLYLDPDADIAANWDPGSNNYSYIDDAVRQPGDPGTGTSIDSNSDAVDEYSFPTDTVGVVSSIKIWIWASNSDNGEDATADIYVNSAYTGSAKAFSIVDSTPAWYSVEWVDTYDQADITALQVKLTQDSGGNNRTNVYELYVEVTYAEAGGGVATGTMKTNTKFWGD